jgi:hypothetical protein
MSQPPTSRSPFSYTDHKGRPIAWKPLVIKNLTEILSRSSQPKSSDTSALISESRVEPVTLCHMESLLTAYTTGAYTDEMDLFRKAYRDGASDVFYKLWCEKQEFLSFRRTLERIVGEKFKKVSLNTRNCKETSPWWPGATSGTHVIMAGTVAGILTNCG